MNALPLAGRRILVTRARHQAGKLSEGLSLLGAEPVEVPVIEIQPPSDFAPLDRALRQLDSYDWLILTSANTVRALADRAAALGLSLAAATRLNISAVGEATAETARRLGMAVALVPESYVAESLTESLAVQTCGKKVLLARAAIARDVIPHALRTAGATVDVVDAYRNVMPASAPRLLRDAFKKGIDAAAFTSSSSVAHLADAARHAGIAFPFAGVVAISIGPITSKTLRDIGWEAAAEASPSDVPGLIQAARRVLSNR
jgi:uroporphyrinogen-III synthase/uroporphyrinogen III methyltransferase/synthase